MSHQAPVEIDGEILRFAALQVGAAAETIHASAGRQQTVSDHQHRSGESRRLGAFAAAGRERRARCLEDDARRLERPASRLARARAGRLGAAPRGGGAARHHARARLTHRLAARLSAPMRDRLAARVAGGADQPPSPLPRIKASASNPSVGGMTRLLARLALIEAPGVLGIDVGWVTGN